MTQTFNSARPKTISTATPPPVGEPLELSTLAPGTAPWFTIIVPTRNEAGNVGPLLDRLAADLGQRPVEVLFVDDSEDDTPEAVAVAARQAGLAVRLLHRLEGQRSGGLSGAVVQGLRHARGSWAVIMDGDLQHPPELASQLVAIGQSRQLDLVAATRYQGSGEAAGLAGGYRRMVSGLSTRLAKALFPRRLSRLSDPMSGFFAIRLAALDIDRLNPLGFKILLEIAVRRPHLQVAEVPFVFGVRLAEQSKAGVGEGLRYLRHLLRLRMLVLRQQVKRSSAGDSLQRLRRMVAFGLVGVSGLVVNTGVLWLLTRAPMNHHYLWAAVIATEFSTTWNFVLTELAVFRGKKPGTLRGRATRFYLLNHLALLLRLPLLALLVAAFGVPVLLANILTLTLLFLVRFLVADAAIYAESITEENQKQPMRLVIDTTARESKPAAPATPLPARPGRSAASARRHLPYRYSIDGLITVGSQVALPELEYFRAQWVGSDVDLSVRIGQVGQNAPRSRALMTQYTSPPAVRYQEHFGRLGANFHVEIGKRVEVICSPALAGSPHVLYTNVIEALLRFLAVSRDKILLHSACLELNGTGLLLSARTDTGKTGSVLRLVRDFGARFLSDDMTIIDAQGNATCFPKPLTISHHTLRAVQAGDLSAAEWRRLKVQSRLHSKEGRQFGLLLASMNIPIMGINSLTQRIVPPPKYDVDRLVDCGIIRNTAVENLFVIERGTPALADIPFDEAIQTLVENTDDAYGFPPFRQMAPSIVIGERDYAGLRVRERALLTSAMANIRIRRLASDSFSWADDIAALLAPAETAAVAQPQPAMLANPQASTAIA